VISKMKLDTIMVVTPNLAREDLWLGQQLENKIGTERHPL
jgi:hypothetical protein